MNELNKKKISKFLSLILRHKPETIGIKLDENGWAEVDELIVKCAQKHHAFTLEELYEIVETNDKQRFAFSDDETHIRASQGHSIDADLMLEPRVPPDMLYHGTVAKFLEGIREKGLIKMSRQHIHLSDKLETAIKVGSRQGKPVILSINSGEMHKDHLPFYLSANGVWLTDHVPAKYIQDYKE